MALATHQADLTSKEDTTYLQFFFVNSQTKKIIRDCVDDILNIYIIYGFQPDNYKMHLQYQYYYYLVSIYNNDWVKLFKDKLASLRSFHNDQDLPSVKCCSEIFHAGILLGGRALRFFYKLKRSDPEKFESFLVSLGHTKSGMTRPTKDYLKEAVQATFNILTVTPSDSVPSSLILPNHNTTTNIHPKVEYQLNMETAKAQLARTVHEIFDDVIYDDDDRIEPYFPSSSANYNNTRSSYGIFGDLLSQIAPEIGEIQKAYPRDDQHVQLYIPSDKIEELKIRFPNYIDPFITDNGFVVERKNFSEYEKLEEFSKLFFSHLHTDEELVSVTGFVGSKTLPIPIVDDSKLRAKYLELYQAIKESALKEIPIAIPVALAEALKVRVITKGPPQHYFVLKPLQKFLWSTLHKLKTFNLIGTPVTEDFVNKIMSGHLNFNDYFMSVDYSQATNLIRSWVSLHVLDTLRPIIKLTDEEYKLARESLVDHVMLIPEEITRGGITVNEEQRAEQKNGQLMGSILSFPILCIANAAVLRWTKEVNNNKKLSLDKANICVNGDDGILKVCFNGQTIWETIASFFGLMPSLGKVFRSKHFLDINSTNYVYTPTSQNLLRPTRWSPKGSRQIFQETKFVNLGLLKGMKRSEIKNDSQILADPINSLGAQCHELISKCYPGTEAIVYKQFLHFNAKTLARATQQNVPWYVPESYGGIGLPILGDFKPTDLDLRLMRKFYNNQQEFKIESKGEMTWKVWSYVSKRLKDMNILGPATALGTECQAGGVFSKIGTLEGKLAIECLFRAKAFSDVICTKEESDPLVRKAKFWRKLLHSKTPLPEPFNCLDIPLVGGKPSALYVDHYSMTHNSDSSFVLDKPFDVSNFTSPEPFKDLSFNVLG
jgi:hypothetical protein